MPRPLPRDTRAAIASELRDGVAQTLVALAYQLTAAARDCPDVATAARLVVLRALAGDALEQTRALAHAVHPPLVRAARARPLVAPGDPLRPLLRGDAR